MRQTAAFPREAYPVPDSSIILVGGWRAGWQNDAVSARRPLADDLRKPLTLQNGPVDRGLGCRNRAPAPAAKSTWRISASTRGTVAPPRDVQTFWKIR